MDAFSKNREGHTGTVISTPEGPSSVRFSFVVDAKNAAKKGQFVQVETIDGIMIARIDELLKANRYYERAESISEINKNLTEIGDIFPVDRWECLVANAEILGVFSEKNISRAVYPPSPGSRVYPAQSDLVVRFLGLNMKSGLDIGSVSYQNIPAKIDMTRLLQKHFAILAMSGAGKSYLTSVILEELIERKAEDGSVAVVIADPHGEYASFGSDTKYLKKVRIIRGSDIRLPVSALTSSQISAFFSSIKEVHEHVVDRAINAVKAEFKEKGYYDIEDIISAVKDDSGARQSVKDHVALLLESLKRMNLFGKSPHPAMKDIKQGNVLVLDLSDILNSRKRQIIVANFASMMFSARQKGQIPPFLLVVEEAHNFAPEKVRKENAISKSIIEKIAREGRKFYAGLCLITQRPVHLSTTALSQCNTHIILRVTNPYDLDHIQKTSEGLTSDVVRSISSLRTGEAIIVGSAVNYPVFITVRERKSLESAHSKPLEKACIEYSEKKENDKKDLDAFM